MSGVDPWGSGSAPHREQMERASKEIIRRVKLEAKNDAAFVPTGNDASNILASRSYVLPPAMQERGSNDANDVLASRVFQRPENTTGQGTPLNLPWTLVQRDSHGDFAASRVEVIALKATPDGADDFVLYAPDGTTVILRVPTGTEDVEIATGFLRVAQVRATTGADLELQNASGSAAIVVLDGTTDVTMTTDLDVAGVVSASMFVGDLTGNADTATALAGAPVNVTGVQSDGTALASLLAALDSLGIIIDSTTP